MRSPRLPKNATILSKIAVATTWEVSLKGLDPDSAMPLSFREAMEFQKKDSIVCHADGRPRDGSTSRLTRRTPSSSSTRIAWIALAFRRRSALCLKLEPRVPARSFSALKTSKLPTSVSLMKPKNRPIQARRPGNSASPMLISRHTTRWASLAAAQQRANRLQTPKNRLSSKKNWSSGPEDCTRELTSTREETKYPTGPRFCSSIEAILHSVKRTHLKPIGETKEMKAARLLLDSNMNPCNLRERWPRQFKTIQYS